MQLIELGVIKILRVRDNAMDSLVVVVCGFDNRILAFRSL